MSAQTDTTEITKVLYTASAHTTGGREGGASRTSDGRLDVQFSLPGGPGNGTNPEQLLAVGWSACFVSAMRIAAAKMKIALPSNSAIDAEIDLCTGNEGYYLQARFHISLPGLTREVAQAIVDSAEQLCPYSKALRGKIDPEITII